MLNLDPPSLQRQASDPGLRSVGSGVAHQPVLQRQLSYHGRDLFMRSMAGPEMTTTVPVTAMKNAAKKKKKKKKKANSYKAMMKSVKGDKKSIEEERQAQKIKIAQSLGGGQFSKLEKI
jgi:hypothetical protein